MSVPDLLRHQVGCDYFDYLGKSIGAICQECPGKDCPSTPAPATTTTTTTTTTTPMTTFAKPDDCVTNTDGVYFFLSTTEVFVTCHVRFTLYQFLTNSMSAKMCPRSWTVGVGKTDQIEKKIAIDIEKKDVENYKNAK